jgi:hypothetical protein
MSKQQNDSIEHNLPDINQQKETAANMYALPSIACAIKYLHAAAGFLTKDTWLKAIECGNYKSWPGVNTTNIKKHFLESIKTQKGHMKKQRQNVRSTKVRVLENDNEDVKLDRTIKKHDIMVKVIHARTTMYTNQTGWFPVQSSRGNKLIMVLYEIDGNYIDNEPMQDSQESSLIKAYNTLWARVTKSGKVRPMAHILDNEALELFKEKIQKNCDLQLVPPDTHRENLAERAIQTFKSHFIAILEGLDPSFPITLWDRLLPQAILTLNLLQQAKVDLSVSTYQFMYGEFDYNKMPLAPLGCAVQMHESPNRQKCGMYTH